MNLLPLAGLIVFLAFFTAMTLRLPPKDRKRSAMFLVVLVVGIVSLKLWGPRDKPRDKVSTVIPLSFDNLISAINRYEIVHLKASRLNIQALDKQGRLLESEFPIENRLVALLHLRGWADAISPTLIRLTVKFPKFVALALVLAFIIYVNNITTWFSRRTMILATVLVLTITLLVLSRGSSSDTVDIFMVASQHGTAVASDINSKFRFMQDFLLHSVIILPFLLLWLFIYWRPVAKPEVLDQPHRVHKRTLAKSSVSEELRHNHHYEFTCQDIIFVTEDIKAIQCNPAWFNTNAELLSFGNDTPHQPGMTWEIHVFFTLHNKSFSRVLMYDLHADVYHVSPSARVLASSSFRPRIELSLDNSILEYGRVYEIEPSEYLPVELVFEASLWGTHTPTIIFGLFVDMQFDKGERIARVRMPSDKIYVFQHMMRQKDCRVGARNLEEIATIERGDARTREAQMFYNMMRDIFRKHTGTSIIEL